MLLGEFVPMDHQREDVERLSHHPRINVWNGLGTGKTPTVAWWLAELYLRGTIDVAVLVLPSMCLPDWRMTLCGGACPEGLVLFADCRPPDAGEVEDLLTSGLLVAPGRLLVVATTYGGVRSLISEREGTSRHVVRQSQPLLAAIRGRRVAAVFDESQAAALPTAVQGRACRALASACTAVASVTATPIGNPKSLRLWGLTKLVRPDLLVRHEPTTIRGIESGKRGSFDAFKARYAMLVDPVSRRRNSSVIVASRSFVVDVNTAMVEREVLEPMAPFTCRRRKEDCLDLPDKVHMRRSFRLPVRAQRHMDDLLDHDRAVLDSGTAIVPRNVLEERLRTLQLTGGWVAGEPVHDGKLILLEEVLAEVRENLGTVPTCVWASGSREVVAAALVAAKVKPREAMAEASGCYPPGQAAAIPARYRSIVDRCRRSGVGIIHGPTPDRDRDEVQADWRSGKVHTVAAHPGVAGAGLNWQHCRAMAYYSQPLGSIARRQSEDRMHRKGLTHIALYYDLVSEGGPDEAVLMAHRSERSAAMALLDWILERSKEMAA